jgi:hypothetical protein
MPATYVNIASQTLGSTTSTVTFGSIPNTYTDLVVRFSARSTGSQSVRFDVRYNGDSATNYSNTYIISRYKLDTNRASVRVSNRAQMDSFTMETDDSTASTFSNSEIYIPNYLSTGSKPMSTFSVTESNAGTAPDGLAINAQLYRGTSAISSLSISALGTGFVSGSSFYLYGIKNS